MVFHLCSFLSVFRGISERLLEVVRAHLEVANAWCLACGRKNYRQLPFDDRQSSWPHPKQRTYTPGVPKMKKRMQLENAAKHELEGLSLVA